MLHWSWTRRRRTLLPSVRQILPCTLAVHTKPWRAGVDRACWECLACSWLLVRGHGNNCCLVTVFIFFFFVTIRSTCAGFSWHQQEVFHSAGAACLTGSPAICTCTALVAFHALFVHFSYVSILFISLLPKSNWVRNWYSFSSVSFISSRIADPGELFSSDFQACAQSPRWATRCALDSVSCSCDAAPRTAVRKRALPVMSSPLSEQRKTWSIFAKQIEISQVKAWLATFKARNANLIC